MDTYLDDLFARHLSHVLAQEPVIDEPEEMNWRLFFAHSQDMQGFAADVFVGGANERRHPTDKGFVPLRERWRKDSRELIEDLGVVWATAPMRAQFEQLTVPTRTGGSASEGIDLLRVSGRSGAVVFAQTLDDFSGPMVSRKTNKMIRAYVQNAALLARHDLSFRAYVLAGTSAFPPASLSTFESTTRSRIERDFFNVGPALANYLISDWLLWLWKEGQIDWFENYKPDSVHQAAVDRGLLPAQADHDFVGYCRTVRIPAGFGDVSGKPCPPRVLNACLWQDGNLSSRAQGVRSSAPAKIDRPIRHDRLSGQDESVVTFRDNDEGYRAWLASHPNGYVLNLERSSSSRYLKLHRPVCNYIVDPIRKHQQLTRDYIKTCAPTRDAIDAWCVTTFGIGPQTGCYCVA